MRRSGIPRLLLGIAISAAFLGLVLARVDLAQVGAAMADTAPSGLLMALGVVAVDLAVRAIRWRLLLMAIVPVPPSVGRVAAYLTVGYLANTILPARLGDVARAYLAGAAFGAPRLATLGTVMVERVADGLTMVALAILASLFVAGVSELRDLQAQAVILVAGGAAGLGLAWFALGREPVAGSRPGAALRDLLARLAAGAAALRTIRGAAFVLATTLAAASTASLVAATVAASIGLQLSPAQIVLFMSGIALSLAIPAAPSSVGTFEFAGVLILSSFGVTPERALAAVLLIRLVSTVPMALIGLVVTWALHVRPAAIFASATAAAGDPLVVGQQ